MGHLQWQNSTPFYLVKKGIKSINDLCNNEQGRLSSHTELTNRYQIRCTFLDALQIRLSIPLHWRSAITSNWQPCPDPPSTTGIMVTLPGEDPRDLASFSSKAVYSAIILAKDHYGTAFYKWSEDSAGPLKVNDETEWTSICYSPFRSVRETKVQSLQYKILNRIIPCNSYLKQLRLKEDEACNFCNELDSVVHFLFLCPLVKPSGGWCARGSMTQLGFSCTLLARRNSSLGRRL